MHDSYRVGDQVIIIQHCFPFAVAPVLGTVTKVYSSASDFYEIQPDEYAEVLLLHAQDLAPAEPRSDEVTQASEATSEKDSEPLER